MKKFATMAISIALIGTMVAGGSLAYLSDTDSDVNVMTLGKVEIAQHEYERETNENGSYTTDNIDNQTSYVLKEFTQGKPLLPAIIPNGGTVNGVKWSYDTIPVRMSQVDSHGGASVFNTPNAQDKFVTVENTGKTDAYVRTLIAFEVGTATINDKENYPDQDLISAEICAEIAEKNTNGKQPWTYGFMDYATINGNKYLVYELVYTGAMTSSGWKHENGILPAGETTYPNLCQVYMASRATNEDVEKLDGNKNGMYDILVLSQAVQADGFEADTTNSLTAAQVALNAGFGEVNETNVKAWFEGENLTIPTAVVETAKELADAVANGEDVVLLTNDITMSNGELVIIPENASVVIDLNGKTLTGGKQIANKTKSVYAIENKGTLTLKNGTVSSRGIGNYGTLIVEDGVYNAVDNNGGAAIWNYEGSNVTVNGGTFTAADTNTTPGAQAMWVASGATAVVNGGTFKSEADLTYAIISEGNLTINDANIIGEHGAIAADNGTLIINGGTYDITASGHTIYTSNAKVTINDGTFKHSQANATAEGNCVVYATSDVVINGGTFDSENAAFAYKDHNASITVNGGTFMNSATNVYSNGTLNDFVTEGHTATANTDGSVTVK